MSRTALAAVAFAVLLAPARALADAPHGALDQGPPPVPLEDRPTSGELSIFSGRTLGKDRTVLAAGAGWPGAFVELQVAPSSTFNVGFRGTFDYASPWMGLQTGLGGELQSSARLHLTAVGTTDVSLAGRVVGVLGQSTLVGFPAAFTSALGWGAHAEAGVVAGFELDPRFTLTLGGMLGGGLVDLPDTGTASVVGLGTLVAAGEIGISDAVMLFIHFEGGAGFHTGDPSFFGSPLILRGSVGLAFSP